MICPRCDHDQASKIFEAPEDASWEVYRCPRCYFVWRSTEGEEVTNPELYDPRFKLNEEKIRAMDPKPPIPPLKRA
ncbi:MAG: non-oxidative hydroxyarylic acid decarboxylases subunit D [Pseudomonadota bacterium]